MLTFGITLNSDYIKHVPLKCGLEGDRHVLEKIVGARRRGDFPVDLCFWFTCSGGWKPPLPDVLSSHLPERISKNEPTASHRRRDHLYGVQSLGRFVHRPGLLRTNGAAPGATGLGVDGRRRRGNAGQFEGSRLGHRAAAGGHGRPRRHPEPGLLPHAEDGASAKVA